jgi:predicted RNA binding protein YcfA (HicA-like mRNA interferase family)
LPKKIRELIRELEMAGFLNRGGKGSHRNYMHPLGVILTISGRPGDDAKPYQVRLVEEKIGETKR